MKKKTILIFHPALAPYRVDFFNSISKKFPTHFYFNHRNVPAQKFDQNYLQSQLLFRPNFLDRGFNFWGRTIRFGIIKRIMQHNPQIIICTEFGQITIIVFLLKKILRQDFKLYTISDDSIDNSKSRTGIRSFLRNSITKNVDGVIYPSIDVGDWNRKNISKKIHALELPIIHSDEKFRIKLENSLNQAAINYKKYNLEGKKVMLFVGRLVEVKNVPVLINAISKIHDKSYVLVVVGDGPLANELKSMVANSNLVNQVVFTGRLEGKALYSWFILAQVLILPSTYEPFGAVVNEALLGGCFVLCSKLAGASSLINGLNGLLFNPYKEDELVEKISMVLKNIDPIQDTSIFLRPSKMPFTYRKKIEQLIDSL
jgi:glycosyltransferase involved in cell wall biosynthesis